MEKIKLIKIKGAHFKEFYISMCQSAEKSCVCVFNNKPTKLIPYTNTWRYKYLVMSAFMISNFIFDKTDIIIIYNPTELLFNNCMF